MKIIKKGQTATNLSQILHDHRLSWSSKGIYADLIYLPNGTHINPVEFSTHANDGINVFKTGIRELIRHKYLVIYNKLLIIKSLNKKSRSVTKVDNEQQVISKHENQVTNEFLKNQWLIVWHRDDARVPKALTKLAKYLNPTMVLYGIQVSKQHCHHYRESLPYLNRLIMEWKQNHLTSIGQTQRWIKQRKLKAKPWNSEIQNRIFGSRKPTTLNNTPLKKGIPNVFKKH